VAALRQVKVRTLLLLAGQPHTRRPEPFLPCRVRFRNRKMGTKECDELDNTASQDLELPLPPWRSAACIQLGGTRAPSRTSASSTGDTGDTGDDSRLTGGPTAALHRSTDRYHYPY